MKKMPVAFIGHGSPMNAIENNRYTESWKKIADSMPRPRAIVIFSAHWITPGENRISSDPHPKMIYDMGGFPDELYRLQYGAPGDITLASEIQMLMQSQDIVATLDAHRGFDHGVWSILCHMFPGADIPVVCMSIDYYCSPESLYSIGKSIKKLRESGVFIMASGNMVHNLGAIDWTDTQAYPWAQEFDKKASELIVSREFDALFDFRAWGDFSRLAHPTYDHLLPIFPILGASDIDDRVEFSTPDISMGSLSMRSIVWY